MTHVLKLLQHAGCVGGIYEYLVEAASHTAAPSLEKRTAKLAVAVAAQAEEMRRHSNRMDHMPPPGQHSNDRLVVSLSGLASWCGVLDGCLSSTACMQESLDVVKLCQLSAESSMLHWSCTSTHLATLHAVPTQQGWFALVVL